MLIAYIDLRLFLTLVSSRLNLDETFFICILFELDLATFLWQMSVCSFHLIVFVLHKWWYVALGYMIDSMNHLPGAFSLGLDSLLHLLLQSLSSFYNVLQISIVLKCVIVLVDVYLLSTSKISLRFPGQFLWVWLWDVPSGSLKRYSIKLIFVIKVHVDFYSLLHQLLTRKFRLLAHTLIFRFTFAHVLDFNFSV